MSIELIAALFGRVFNNGTALDLSGGLNFSTGLRATLNNAAGRIDIVATVDAPIDPAAFGAVGDGTTDDTGALQSAIDYVESLGGGTLLLTSPSGYATTGLYVDSPNVAIVGRYPAKLIMTSTTDNAISITASDCRIEDLTIEQSGTATAGAHFQMSSGATYGKLLNCTSIGGYWGAEVADYQVEVRGFRAIDSENLGIRDVVSANCTYSDITIKDCLGTGFEVAGDYHTITGVNINGATYGLHLKTTALGVSVAGGFITGCSSHGVYLQGGECSISGVVSRSNTGCGIQLGSGADHNVVAGNTFHSNASAGIEFATAGSTHNVVKGNALASNGTDLSTSAITIAAGVVAMPAAIDGVWRLDTEGAAAADDLNTINSTVAGQTYTFQCQNSARVVTLKDGTGNLSLAGDFALDNTADRIVLQSDGTTLFEIGRSSNA